jgi:aminobenzoyl-glutamate utilization protein B
MHLRRVLLIAVAVSTLGVAPGSAQPGAAQIAPASPIQLAPPSARTEALKRDVVADVESRRVFTQQLVDSLFSYSELGFQETETQRHLTDTLIREGFDVQRSVAGVPTAWLARYGSGKPVIALGTDVDGLPTTSQTPGVVTRKQMVDGAPGHGEGHNAGQALVITAALAVKKIMDRDKLPGTLIIWPGVAEELLGTKAFYVRDGVFKDVDATLFVHVGSDLTTSWGESSGGSGMISVEYSFTGSSAHAAGVPWLGKSALDAVELMNIAWNYKREHLRLAQRSHYVITYGGHQPNVVPPKASVWYYFREADYDHIKELWDLGDTFAKAATMMTGTSVESRVLGSAWPQHGNRPLAEAMQANISTVGLPEWTDADQQFAKAFQRAMGAEEKGLAATVAPLRGRESVPADEQTGGGSDDIGDVMWTVPTITMRFPSNIPGAIGHHWTSAVAMATPVAHKGATQGAKAYAMTIVDLLTRPDLLSAARTYFNDVQKAPQRYKPLLRPQDKPAVFLNKETMDEFRPALKKLYYDPTKYTSYLEQLGVQYPPPMPAEGDKGINVRGPQ